MLTSDWYIRLLSTDPKNPQVLKYITLDQLLVDPEHKLPIPDSRLETTGAALLGRTSSKTDDAKVVIKLPSQVISKYHAEIGISSTGHVYIHDLLSRHGTVIKSHNRQPLTEFSPVQLLQDDIVSFGTKTFSARYKQVGRWVVHTPCEVKIDFRHKIMGKPLNNVRDTDRIRSDLATIGSRDHLVSLIRALKQDDAEVPIDPVSKINARGSSDEDPISIEDDEEPPRGTSVQPIEIDDSPQASERVDSSHAYGIPPSVLYSSDDEDEDLPRGSVSRSSVDTTEMREEVTSTTDTVVDKVVSVEVLSISPIDVQADIVTAEDQPEPGVPVAPNSESVADDAASDSHAEELSTAKELPLGSSDKGDLEAVIIQEDEAHLGNEYHEGVHEEEVPVYGGEDLHKEKDVDEDDDYDEEDDFNEESDYHEEDEYPSEDEDEEDAEDDEDDEDEHSEDDVQDENDDGKPKGAEVDDAEQFRSIIDVLGQHWSDPYAYTTPAIAAASAHHIAQLTSSNGPSDQDLASGYEEVDSQEHDAHSDRSLHEDSERSSQEGDSAASDEASEVSAYSTGLPFLEHATVLIAPGIPAEDVFATPVDEAMMDPPTPELYSGSEAMSSDGPATPESSPPSLQGHSNVLKRKREGEDDGIGHENEAGEAEAPPPSKAIKTNTTRSQLWPVTAAFAVGALVGGAGTIVGLMQYGA